MSDHRQQCGVSESVCKQLQKHHIFLKSLRPNPGKWRKPTERDHTSVSLVSNGIRGSGMQRSLLSIPRKPRAMQATKSHPQSMSALAGQLALLTPNLLDSFPKLAFLQVFLEIPQIQFPICSHPTALYKACSSLMTASASHLSIFSWRVWCTHRTSDLDRLPLVQGRPLGLVQAFFLVPGVQACTA